MDQSQSGLEINDQDTINRAELATNCNNYIGTDTSTTVVADDTAVLTSNQLPNPISSEDVQMSENTNQRAHQQLDLQMSQSSQKSISMMGNTHAPLRRATSVITQGGRVVRNISMNNSVKYDIASAYEKYPSVFSSYDNVFRPGSVKQNHLHHQQQQQQQKRTTPSLRRDGQVRRTSRHERTTSDRSMSVSSSEDNFVNKNNTKFTNQTSTDSCTSVTSNTQLVITNPYNIVNQKIYSAIWCPCFFFFCFICSLPAIQLMRRSDKFFNENNYDKARTYAKLSTALYILAVILSIAFVAAIFALIIFFI